MKRPPKKNLPSAKCLHCRVELTDVEEMFDAYDSGMCDIITSNCISRAVSRRLPDMNKVRLRRHDGVGELEIRSERIPVPDRLMRWLADAETGKRVEPIDFVLRIPETGSAQAPATRSDSGAAFA